MRIAIGAQGATLDAAVDPRFGRAAFFLLYDLASGEVESHANALDAAQGAGIQAAALVSRIGADALIAAHCGPKAFRALDAAEILVYAAPESGSVREAIALFRKGGLPQLQAANVEGHW